MRSRASRVGASNGSSDTFVSDDLETLRGELADVDRGILALVARRRTLAESIGKAKSRVGRGTRDFAQERVVLDRVRTAADALGVPRRLAEDLLRLLIGSSLTVQEHQRIAESDAGSGQRALVIGGSGRMGGWLAGFLASQGFAVTIADPVAGDGNFEHVADWRDAEGDFAMTVVAAPLRISARVLNELAESPPTGIVFDVGSLKSPLREGLKRLRDAGARVTSVHPMFGPDAELLSGRHVVFCDVGCPEATHAARALFEPTMAELVTMDLDTHDRLMAWVLGLSHALNVAFFTALASGDAPVSELSEVSSTTFDTQLRAAAPVASENPRLYFEIQALNAHGGDSLKALSEAVETIRSLVAAGDEEGFVRLMEQGRTHLSESPLSER